MRIKITLQSTSKQVLDINYNYQLSSMIYKMLRQSDEGYSSFLHEKGYENNKKNYKLFTFSQLKPEKYEIQGPNMIIQGTVSFLVSSPIKEFIVNFANSLLQYQHLNINSCILKITNVEVVPEPKYSRNMKFKCISPMAMSTAFLTENSRLKKIDLYIEDKRFIENLKSNILSKYEILYGTIPEDREFNVSWFNIDKYKKGKLINYKNNIKIKAYFAQLQIQGNPELISVAYECGLGDRNSLGLGMIDIDRRR